jgi:hypothetical protein
MHITKNGRKFTPDITRNILSCTLNPGDCLEISAAR